MTLSAASFAHVDLSSPNPRSHGQTEGNLKSGPCGQSTDGRTANVNVFAPGETITVTWNEYIDHPAYYRIAFDDDGDDGFVMRTDGQTDQAADDPEAMEAALNMDAEILAIVTEENDTSSGTSTDIRNVDVTLPNITCENCTLQLIQYMYNNPTQGYFQCADIALRAEQNVGDADAGPAGDGGSANAGSAGAAGAGGAGGAGSDSPGMPTSTSGGGAGETQAPPAGSGGGSVQASGGAAPASMAGGAPVADDGVGDDGGCTIARHGGNANGSASLLGLLVLGLGCVVRRRRA
jgi:hypothetical protein